MFAINMCVLTQLQQKNDLLVSEQTRLQQLVSDLRTDLSCECQLSARLDESHRSLTQHVHDMEMAVELEKEQVC